MSPHDDDRSDDTFDDDDAAEQALAGRLATLLADRAGALVVADEPFDPTRPSAFDLDIDLDLGGVPPAAAAPLRVAPGGSDGGHDEDGAVPLRPLPIEGADAARRGWVVWLAGAAAAAVLVAAIVAINAVRQPSVRTGEETAPLVGPDTGWAPTWVPDGLELWSLETGHGDPRSIIAGVSADVPVPVVQLLESATTDARVLVSIVPETQERRNGAPITIRGTSGTTMPGSAARFGPPGALSLEWSEGGSAFGASVIGLDQAAAVAVLDGLVLADAADPGVGFAAPPDPTWTVRTDDPRGRPETDVVVGVFGYDRARPTGERVPLQVLTQGAGSPLSAFPGYLATAFLGSIGDDGVARAFTPGAGDRPTQSYTVWPDGRTVYTAGIDLDEASANRIADSIEPVTRAELEARADEASAKLGAAAVLASSDLPSGTVEVIGDGEPSAICLTVAERRVCRTAESMDDMTPRLMASVLVDGTWYVVAASDTGAVELGAGSSGSFVGSGTALGTTVESAEVTVVPDVPVPTSQGPGGDIEVFTSAVPDGPGPGSATSLPPTEAVVDPGITSGTGPPDRSVPFESAVMGPWTLALLVVPPDATAAWASFGDGMVTFPRPSR